MATKHTFGFWTALVAGTLITFPSLAQPGGGNFDPAAFRQQMNDRIKQALGSTDEEYQAIQPKIEKLMTLRRDAGGGFRMFGRGGPGGPGGGADQQPQSAVQQASRDLQTTLENKDAKPEEIKAKLAALRDAKEKAKKDMGQAQTELKELLTQRQEAVMVMMGFLD